MRIIVFDRSAAQPENRIALKDFDGGSYQEAIWNAKLEDAILLTEDPVQMKGYCEKAGMPATPAYPIVKVEIGDNTVLEVEKTTDFELYFGDDLKEAAYCILFGYKDSIEGQFCKGKLTPGFDRSKENALRLLREDVEKHGVETVMQWIYEVKAIEQLET